MGLVTEGFRLKIRIKDLSCKMTFEAFYVGSATDICSESHLDLLAPLTPVWIQVSSDGVNGIASV